MKREIETIMLKLADGARIMRFSEPTSGLCLEKRLNEQQPVFEQQRHWRQVFETMIERELGAAG